MNTESNQQNSNNEVSSKTSNKNTVNKNNSKSAAIIRRVVLVIAALVFCFSAYMLVNIFLEYKQGRDVYNNIQDSVLDDNYPNNVTFDNSGETVEIPFKYDHAKLLSMNPDGVGYLYIPAIEIRLPIVQSQDNDFYLTHTFDKSENKDGCLFEDCNIEGGLSSTNVIIYGHNMKDGSMFGKLSKFKTIDFWQTDNNDKFYIYTENKLKEYRIFSVYVSEPVSDTYTYNFSSQAGLAEYATKMKNLSIYDTGIDVSNASQVVTLSTCTSDGSKRLIVHGILTNEGSLDNN